MRRLGFLLIVFFLSLMQHFTWVLKGCLFSPFWHASILKLPQPCIISCLKPYYYNSVRHQQAIGAPLFGAMIFFPCVLSELGLHSGLPASCYVHAVHYVLNFVDNVFLSKM
uniref:Uncharacterized protein n=1 Tax=Opuntia streptacantha TaxID=393608 RepID=A0A7C9DBS5_OPUST